MFQPHITPLTNGAYLMFVSALWVSESVYHLLTKVRIKTCVYVLTFFFFVNLIGLIPVEKSDCPILVLICGLPQTVTMAV